MSETLQSKSLALGFPIIYQGEVFGPDGAVRFVSVPFGSRNEPERRIEEPWEGRIEEPWPPEEPSSIIEVAEYLEIGVTTHISDDPDLVYALTQVFGGARISVTSESLAGVLWRSNIIPFPGSDIKGQSLTHILSNAR